MLPLPFLSPIWAQLTASPDAPWWLKTHPLAGHLGRARADPGGSLGPGHHVRQDRRPVLAARLDRRLGHRRAARTATSPRPGARLDRRRLDLRAASSRSRSACSSRRSGSARSSSAASRSRGLVALPVRPGAAGLDRARPLGDDRPARQGERPGRPRPDPRGPGRWASRLGRSSGPSGYGRTDSAVGDPPRRPLRRDVHGPGRPGPDAPAGRRSRSSRSGRGGSTRSPS